MWMDARHVKFIYDLCMAYNFKSVLEIGAYMGWSTSALIQAIREGKKFELTVAEVNIQPSLKKLLMENGKLQALFNGNSLDAMKRGKNEALIVVDGDHRIDQVSREVGYLLLNETPTVLAHDVSGAREEFAGAAFLGKVFRAHPAYKTLTDDRWRPGEWTERGFLFATRLPDVWEKAQPIWKKMIA